MVLPRKRHWICDPTSGRYPSLHYSRSRSELASVLVIITQILKVTLYREQVGKSLKMRLSFWSASVPSHFWLAFENFCHALATIDYFFSCFSFIIYPPAILFCSQNWEKIHREWQFWLGREVDDGVRTTLRFLPSWLFSFLPIMEKNQRVWLFIFPLGTNCHVIQRVS